MNTNCHSTTQLNLQLNSCLGTVDSNVLSHSWHIYGRIGIYTLKLVDSYNKSPKKIPRFTRLCRFYHSLKKVCLHLHSLYYKKFVWTLFAKAILLIKFSTI